jgi:hypothetical protein
MPKADGLMMRIYAAMAQKERELISERTRAPLAGRPSTDPDANPAARCGVWDGAGSTPVGAGGGGGAGEGVTSPAALAQALT